MEEKLKNEIRTFWGDQLMRFEHAPWVNPETQDFLATVGVPNFVIRPGKFNWHLTFYEVAAYKKIVINEYEYIIIGEIFHEKLLFDNRDGTVICYFSLLEKFMYINNSLSVFIYILMFLHSYDFSDDLKSKNKIDNIMQLDDFDEINIMIRYNNPSYFWSNIFDYYITIDDK